MTLAKVTPRPFTHTLATLKYGHLNDELAEELQSLVQLCGDTGKSGKLTLTITLKPGKGGQMEVFDEVTVKKPKAERSSTLMFASVDHALQREDPRQLQLSGLRSIDSETGEIRKVG